MKNVDTMIGGYALRGLAIEDLGSAELDYLEKVWRVESIAGSKGRADTAKRILTDRGWYKRRDICLRGRCNEFPDCLSANEQILQSSNSCACAKKLARYFIAEGEKDAFRLG